MNNFDPRIEKILSRFRTLWYSMPLERRDFVWDFLKKINGWKNKQTVRVYCDEGGVLVKARPKAVTQANWDELKVRYEDNIKTLSEQKIDVVVPIYKGYDETLRCLYSVLTAKTEVSYELVLINDKSPDEELIKKIRQISRQFSNVRLFENKVNLGFVKSTNIGLSLHPDRDVVLLNSDTEVFDFWLDKLRKVADLDPKVGTITPLTNNSTISSYPSCNEDFPFLYNIPDSELDYLAGNVNSNELITTPTGIGCCMYIRRCALQKVGLLDELKFGRGYGEENDLCQRISKAGWKNVIYSGLFVRHYGGVSFSKETLRRKKHSSEVINGLYPDYFSKVSSWILEDPLKISRTRLDCARLLKEQSFSSNKRILLITHNIGGGVETFIQDLKRELLARKIEVFICRSEEDGKISFDCNKQVYPNLHGIDPKYNYSTILEILRTLEISNIHINHLINYPDYFGDMLTRLSGDLGVPITYTLHDYYCCCPFITTFKDDCWTCDVLTESQCNTCSCIHQSESSWLIRNRSSRIFNSCFKITVPNEDVKQRLKNLFPGIQFSVVPHYEKNLPAIKRIKSEDGILRLAIVGAIVNNAKGSEYIKKFATYLKQNNEKAKLILIGCSNRVRELKSLGLEITGFYKDESTARDLLRKYKVDACLIPSIWPETYSYTLSLALRSGLPTFVFDLGAQAERMRCLNLEKNIIPYEERENFSLVLKTVKDNLDNVIEYRGSENYDPELLYYK